MHKQSGQIATILTLVAMGVMTLGTLVGTWVIKSPSSPYYSRAAATCVSLNLTNDNIPEYNSTYNITVKLCNETNESTQVHIYAKETDKNIDSITGSLGAPVMLDPKPACRETTFTFNMVGDWVSQQGTVAYATIYATSRDVAGVGCYKDLSQTVTFGKVVPTATSTITPTPSVMLTPTTTLITTPSATPTSIPTPTMTPICPFKATALVQDTSGNEIDGTGFFTSGNLPNSTSFDTHGKNIFSVDNLANDKKTTNASITLSLSGDGYWHIASSFCSTACRQNYTCLTQPKCPTTLDTSATLTGFNVDCGAEYSYGWKLNYSGPTFTPTPTSSPTPTPTVTTTPAVTTTPTVTTTPGATATPTITTTPGATVTPTVTGVVTATPTPTPTPTPTKTPTPTATPLPTCGNGTTDPGEDCDGTDQECNWQQGEQCVNCRCVSPTPTPTPSCQNQCQKTSDCPQGQTCIINTYYKPCNKVMNFCALLIQSPTPVPGTWQMPVWFNIENNSDQNINIKWVDFTLWGKVGENKRGEVASNPPSPYNFEGNLIVESKKAYAEEMTLRDLITGEAYQFGYNAGLFFPSRLTFTASDGLIQNAFAGQSVTFSQSDQKIIQKFVINYAGPSPTSRVGCPVVPEPTNLRVNPIYSQTVKAGGAQFYWKADSVANRYILEVAKDGLTLHNSCPNRITKNCVDVHTLNKESYCHGNECYFIMDPARAGPLEDGLYHWQVWGAKDVAGLSEACFGGPTSGTDFTVAQPIPAATVDQACEPNGLVNARDYSIIIANYGKKGGKGDVNADGVVNGLDLSLVLKNLGKQVK